MSVPGALVLNCVAKTSVVALLKKGSQGVLQCYTSYVGQWTLGQTLRTDIKLSCLRI